MRVYMSACVCTVFLKKKKKNGGSVFLYVDIFVLYINNSSIDVVF
jgi:hypothetical protein